MNDSCGWVFIVEEERTKAVGVVGIYMKVDGKLNEVVSWVFEVIVWVWLLRWSRRRRFGWQWVGWPIAVM